MKIGICCDHHGINIKEQIIAHLKNLKYEVVDYGTYDKKPVDYPDIAFKMGEDIGKKIDVGIAMCRTGIGMSIALNKVKHVRCAHAENINEAKLTRLDNDANALAFSTELPLNTIFEIINTFLQTSFSNEERHKRRIDKIKEYEDML